MPLLLNNQEGAATMSATEYVETILGNARRMLGLGTELSGGFFLQKEHT